MTQTIGQTHPEYILESTDVLTNALKGIGFAMLMFGTYLYHEKKQKSISDSKEGIESNEVQIGS